MTAISSLSARTNLLWKRWSAVPDDATPIERRFHSWIAFTFPAGWLIHLFYIFIFAAWGVWPLAIINVFSLGLWSLGLLLWYRQRPALGFAVSRELR